MLSTKRVQHFIAMILIGDGVMALIHPQRDAHAWKKGPKLWQGLMHTLSENPGLTRVIGVTQIAGGVLWALSQSKEE